MLFVNELWLYIKEYAGIYNTKIEWHKLEYISSTQLRKHFGYKSNIWLKIEIKNGSNLEKSIIKYIYKDFFKKINKNKIIKLNELLISIF